MRWIIGVILPGLLTACAWLHPDVIREREVVVTDPPNKLLEPFLCGKRSIDVSNTVKSCKLCKPPKPTTK